MSSVLTSAAVFVVFVLVTWVVFRRLGGSTMSRAEALRTRLRRRRAPNPPRPVAPPTRPPRPLEDIVSDARRFAPRVHEPPRGTSYAKHLAVCSVYDRVLGEACAALDIEHLLGVLPPGEERDAERTRIETALWLAGLRLEDVA